MSSQLWDIKGRIYLLGAASALALISAGSPALAQEAAQGQQANELETVVVTARRREETLERTPVSVQVITARQLENRGVKTTYDLVSLTPGVNISSGSSKSNPIISVRGMSRGFVGAAQPAVSIYLDEVPSLKESAAMALYDIDSVQILKGPQGTLFGRNATTGAILVTARKPAHAYGASAQVTLGSYNWHTFDGVVNLPIIQDKVTLRLAGQLQRRDGYTKSGNRPGMRSDVQDVDNFRVSLLVEPTEKVSNLTVFDYNQNHNGVGGAVLYRYVPGGAADLLPFWNGTLLYTNPVTPCNGNPVCDIKAALARQQVVGPRVNFVDPLLPTPFNKQGNRSVINTTTVDLGFAKLKNIFGYRGHKLDTLGNIEGLELTFVNSATTWDLKQYSDELQLSGEALKGNLNWITGAFWLKEGPSLFTSYLQLLQPTNISFAAGAGPGTATFTTTESKAVYGQINFKFDGVSPALHGLSTDLGIRYTKDENSVCSVTGLALGARFPKADQCPAAQKPTVKFSQYTYTAGLNYQATDDVLAYIVHRTGYRGGFSNAPIFGGQLVPFQGVEPETVKDFEVGLKTTWRIGDMPGRFNVAAFKSRFKGLQASIVTTGQADPDGDGNPANNPLSNAFYVNVGDAKTKGLEVDAAFSPMEGLELAAAASWLGKEVTKVSLASLPTALRAANPLTPGGLAPTAFYSAPRYGYTASANYTLPLPEHYGTVTAGLTYFGTSAITYLAATLPSYFSMNATLDWSRVMGSNVDLGLFVTNFTNELAPVGGAQIGPGIGIISVHYNEPRMVGLRLRYAFGSER